mgnify:CR=1 FL=1
MSLLTAEDFQKQAVTQPTLKVYELSLKRMQDAAKDVLDISSESAAIHKLYGIDETRALIDKALKGELTKAA